MQYNAIQDNAIQYNTIQCNTIQYNTMQCNTIQCNTIQYNTIQYNTIQYNTIQCNAMQYNTIQYNTMQNKKKEPRHRNSHRRFHFQENLLPEQVSRWTLTRLHHPSQPSTHPTSLVPSQDTWPFTPALLYFLNWRGGGDGGGTGRGEMGLCYSRNLLIGLKKMKNELGSLTSTSRDEILTFCFRDKKKFLSLRELCALPTRTTDPLYMGRDRSWGQLCQPSAGSRRSSWSWSHTS